MPCSRCELIAALFDRPVARAKPDDADVRAVDVLHHRLGHVLPRRLELAREPLHVANVVVRTLAVLRLLVVAGAAREVRGHLLAGDRAVGNAIAVDVLVAAPLADARERFGIKALAAVERLVGIRERFGHPGVHPEVQIAHHEYHHLEALGQVERLHGHRVALLDGGRDEHDLLGVTVGEHGGRQQIALRRACRKSRRRAHALDVEHHARHLGVVRQSGELAHERDAGAGRGRHRPRTRPPRADHHPDGGDLVLRLHDRVGRLSGFRILAVLLEIADERFWKRRRGSNRIPRDDGHARHHAAKRRRGIPLDQDHPGRLVYRLGPIRIALDQVLLGVGRTGLERGHVQLDRFLLLAHLSLERVLHLRQVDVQELRQHAVVNHVLHEPAQLRVLADLGHDAVEGHRVEHEVVAERAELQGLVVEHGAAGSKREDVLPRGLRVHRNQEIDFFLAGDIPILIGTDGVPGGKTCDVRREHVLARHGHTHLEQRT